MDKADKLFAQLGYKKEKIEDPGRVARDDHLVWSGFHQRIQILQKGDVQITIQDTSVILSDKEIAAIYKALREEGMMCGWGKEWK